jgi:small subunit ribosomal protein S9
MVKTETQYDANIQVEGGGLSAQAQATRLALAKALIEVLPNSRALMKKQGFLTRDARIKERRKYGLKKARKAPQFSKR